METILKTGYEKILKVFYKNKRAKLHLRDIARKTKLNENSVSRFLKQLENESILKFEKDGNLKKYYIKDNNKVYFIWSLFDLQRYDKMPEIRKQAIHYFFEELNEKPIIMVLFGSSAKGTFMEKSDVDLLLIVNKKISVNKAEDYAESQTSIKINCLQIKYNDFKKEIKIKEDRVIQSAINSGYPLNNTLWYYEMIK